MDDHPSPSTDNLSHWLVLLHTPGLGAVGISRLLERYPNPSQLIGERVAADLSALPQATRKHLQRPDWARIEQDLQWLEESGCQLVTLSDPRYPELLKCIADPPAMLFVLGDASLLSSPQLAMVGSRNPSHTGRETASEFARFLGRSGITITSGLAMGIDGASHQGALEVGAATLAVTGTGLDSIYPASHKTLARQIAEQGALVSEFPPGTPARRENFPRRNRIISGLSLGTLVVEAAIRSGSLITARLATEQGREVFALPGSIHNPLARGCHALIRQGAKLVETAADIIEELEPLLGFLERQSADETPAVEAAEPVWDEDYRQLLACLDRDPVPVERLIQRSGLTADAVSSMLLILELDGHVIAMPGGRYSLSSQYRG